MIKIFFYHASDSIGFDSDRQMYLGIAALYLKTHIDHYRTHIADKIEWLVPQQEKLSDEDLIEKLNKENPNIFCTSHYIWNHDYLSKQIERIKPHVSKDILFVAGGPSIDVNIDKDFFQKHPSIDYAMYGAGETGFADLVESLLEDKKLIKFNTSNIAWYDIDKNKQIVADFKYVPQSKISPYTSNVELFSKMVSQVTDKGIIVIVPYELTRGCPYKCTFCDWNSGLTNKTTRRKGTYVDEIDLFHKLGIKGIYFADANVGQYEEDIDMVAYLARKNIEEGAGFRTDGNFSKLRKENNLKIYHHLARGNLATDNAGFTISVQDTNEQVLQNIDRPDVGWDVHVNMIKELQHNYPSKPSVVQLIQGLPGQTVESWTETLRTVAEHATFMQIFVSELLPASPAARDPEYQEKFQFEYSDAERFNGEGFFRGQFTKSCVSFSQKDFAKMTVLSTIFSAVVHYRRQTTIPFNFMGVIDSFLESPMYDNLVEHLYDNWVNENKFYYSIDFGGKSLGKLYSACVFRRVAGQWAWSHKFLKLIASNLAVDMSPTEYIKRSLKNINGRVDVDLKNNSHYLDYDS